MERKYLLPIKLPLLVWPSFRRGSFFEPTDIFPDGELCMNDVSGAVHVNRRVEQNETTIFSRYGKSQYYILTSLKPVLC